MNTPILSYARKDWSGTVSYQNLNNLAMPKFQQPKPRKGYFIGGKRDGEAFDFWDADDEYEFDGETYVYAGTEADYHIYELWEEYE